MLGYVRAHHPAASPIALTESSGAHRLQACSPCVQVPSRSSTAVPRRRTQPAGQSEPPFHHVVIAVRLAYAAVNYRRPGLFSRCNPCLELSAAARHVCTVSFHLPKPSEDSPLQPLLSSCQAREVISSLRLFMLLLLLLFTTASNVYTTASNISTTASNHKQLLPPQARFNLLQATYKLPQATTNKALL